MSGADGRMEADWVGYCDNLLRYYLHIDPSGLTDAQWAQALAQLADIRQREAGKR